MIKRMIIMLILAGLVFGGVFGFNIFKGMMIKKFMSSMGMPSQTVSTIKAEAQEWQPKFEAVGSLRAEKGVDISSEVPGIVETIGFDSGNDVNQGTKLIQLRAEDDIAHLNALKASAALAQANYARDQKQFAAQVISKEQMDTSAANFKSAQAQVVQQQAIVDKKTIAAPFAGRLGIRNVDVGQYVNPGAAMVTLQSLDPIFLDFFLPQQALATVQVGQKVAVKTDTWPDKTFEGEISAINPKVDESTRNVQLRAVLKNPDHILLPGMYATVNIETGQPQKYLTLPQTAITYNPYGSTVFLVQQDGQDQKGQPKLVAKQSFVKTGETRGDQVAVLSGLKEDDEVVTSGQLKLQNGAPVIVNNTITPTNNPNPDPGEH